MINIAFIFWNHLRLSQRLYGLLFLNISGVFAGHMLFYYHNTMSKFRAYNIDTIELPKKKFILKFCQLLQLMPYIAIFFQTGFYQG